MALLFVDPVSRYARMTYNALSPLLDYALRKDLLAYQQSLEEQALRRRMGQAEQIGRELAQALDVSPTNTYALGQPSFQLQAPELNISPIMGVREKIGEGLLSSGLMDSALNVNLPQQTTFVDILKSPAEYTDIIYQRTLPILTKGAVMNLDLSNAVTSKINAHEKAYQAGEEEAKKWEEMQAKIPIYRKKYSLLAKRTGTELSDDDLDLLAVGKAMGFLSAEDDKLLFKRKATLKDIELESGDRIVVITDENTGEVLKSFPVPLNLVRFRKRKEVEESAKAKYGKKKTGGKWELLVVPKTVKSMTGNAKTVYEPVTVTIGENKYIVMRSPDFSKVKLINLERPWEVIDLTPEEVQRVQESYMMRQRTPKQKQIQEQDYSTVDDRKLVGD